MNTTTDGLILHLEHGSFCHMENHAWTAAYSSVCNSPTKREILTETICVNIEYKHRVAKYFDLYSWLQIATLGKLLLVVSIPPF